MSNDDRQRKIEHCIHDHSQIILAFRRWRINLIGWLSRFTQALGLCFPWVVSTALVYFEVRSMCSWRGAGHQVLSRGDTENVNGVLSRYNLLILSRMHLRLGTLMNLYAQGGGVDIISHDCCEMLIDESTGQRHTCEDSVCVSFSKIKRDWWT